MRRWLKPARNAVPAATAATSITRKFSAIGRKAAVSESPHGNALVPQLVLHDHKARRPRFREQPRLFEQRDLLLP